VAVAGKETWLYINTSTACLVGNGLKQGSTFGQCDLSTANSEIPLGIAIEDAAVSPAAAGPFNSVTVKAVPAQVKMIVGGAVAINVLLTAAAAGRFVTAAKTATPGTAEYIWGRSLEAAATGAGDVISGLFNWFEMDIT